MKSILKLSFIKKFIFAAIFIMLVIPFNLKIKAQDTKLDFTTEITDASSINNNDGSIIITVDGNDSEYLFMIYDKEPWNGGEKIVAEFKSGSMHTITNLKPGNYFVCVQNNAKVTRCINVSVNSTK